MQVFLMAATIVLKVRGTMLRKLEWPILATEVRINTVSLLTKKREVSRM